MRRLCGTSGGPPDAVLDPTQAGVVSAVREPRRTPVALDCAKRNDIMRAEARLHIVELAEGNSRFFSADEEKGSVNAAIVVGVRGRTSRYPVGSPRFQSDQSAPHGDSRHFDPIVDAELGKEAGDVRLDRARADAESFSDLSVVVSRYQQAQHVQLARTEPR